jgi:hypothetical protein
MPTCGMWPSSPPEAATVLTSSLHRLRGMPTAYTRLRWTTRTCCKGKRQPITAHQSTRPVSDGEASLTCCKPPGQLCSLISSTAMLTVLQQINVHDTTLHAAADHQSVVVLAALLAHPQVPGWPGTQGPRCLFLCLLLLELLLLQPAAQAVGHSEQDKRHPLQLLLLRSPP